MVKLHDYLPSGNGYKIRLLLAQLAVPFERIEHDVFSGATRTPEFLAKFPNGRIPALEFEDGRLLFESGAILWYFAEAHRCFRPTPSSARALCSGCSSSSTATSPTSRLSVPSQGMKELPTRGAWTLRG